MKTFGRVTALGTALAFLGPAHAGHEPPVYPSYYPQEIRIEPIDPAAAGQALAEGRIQAYVGTLAGLPAGAKESVKFVESLGSYLVIRVNPASPLAADADGRCALAARAVSALAEEQEGFRFHPYPVNPLHADYLHHFDLAASLSPAAWACGANLRPQGPVEQVFELRIEGGEVAGEVRTLRVTEGDRVRLRWTADAPAILHLHGYDIEKEVTPGRVTEFDLEAYATGRFPVEVHAHGDASHHSHDQAPLVVLEVYPR